MLDKDVRDVITRLQLHRRGCRAGEHHRRRVNAAQVVTSSVNRAVSGGGIPIIIGNRTHNVNNNQLIVDRSERRSTALRTVQRSKPRVADNGTSSVVQHTLAEVVVPSLYLLNAAALSKPNATSHLAADLHSYNTDVAIITETHFKCKHTDSVVSVPGYTLWRRDRHGRRGGGVALYVRSSLQSAEWIYSADNREYELSWVRVGSVFIGAMYHPPKPRYSLDALLDYVEACVQCIRTHP